jgi:hypothetical protein
LIQESDGPSSAAGSKKGKKGGPSSEPVSAAALLDAAGRSEFNELKGKERQRTAEVRAELAALTTAQDADEAAAKALKTSIDATKARAGETVAPWKCCTSFMHI